LTHVCFGGVTPHAVEIEVRCLKTPDSLSRCVNSGRVKDKYPLLNHFEILIENARLTHKKVRGEKNLSPHLSFRFNGVGSDEAPFCVTTDWHSTHSNRVRSTSWHAPEGCDLVLHRFLPKLRDEFGLLIADAD